MQPAAVPKTAELPGGIRLPYVEQGDADGISVLLLHGFSESWRSFERLLPHIPRSVRVVAPTQRGHGDASRPRSGYAVQDLAGDVAALMDALGLARAVVAGHSMGSAVARRIAIDRPDRTIGLVLMGASARVAGNPQARRYWEAKLAELTDPVDLGFLRRSVEESAARPLEPPFLEMLVGEAAKVPAFVWRAAFRARWERREDPGELRGISVPTLICWGAHDSRYPREEQEALRDAIGEARLIVYPEAGHAVHWDEPERFAADLVAFVRDLGAGPE